MTEVNFGEELATVRRLLDTGGLDAVLRYLNGRTPYRFTGLYRYDGDLLRNIALFDSWHREVRRGDDTPLRETFCAIVRETGDWLDVRHGPDEPRFPWMHDNAVVCYSGALIRDDAGEPFGTLCHFDVQRCESSSSDVELLRAAGRLIHAHLRVAT